MPLTKVLEYLKINKHGGGVFDILVPLMKAVKYLKINKHGGGVFNIKE